MSLRIRSIAPILPEHEFDQNDVAELAATLFSQSIKDIERYRPVFENAGVSKRYSVMPLEWYKNPPSFKDRNALFIDHSIKLMVKATRKALEEASLAASDIDGVVVVSTSGIAAPSLDAYLMQHFEFKPTTWRLPIFGLGCAGGLLGLGKAAQMLASSPNKKVLFVVVELCALTFRASDHSKVNLLSTALFGDGAVAMVLDHGESGHLLRHWGEHTWPNSLDVMGWSLEDDGLGVHFSAEVPDIARHKLRVEVERYLDQHNGSLDEVAGFLCHPGGAKVLDGIEAALGVGPGTLTHSRRVLNDCGNMSAATVLFVLAEAIKAQDQGTQLMISMGPGFTAGFATVELNV